MVIGLNRKKDSQWPSWERQRFFLIVEKFQTKKHRTVLENGFSREDNEAESLHCSSNCEFESSRSQSEPEQPMLSSIDPGPLFEFFSTTF